MKKTVFVVTEQRSSGSEREAQELIQRCVRLWLKNSLRQQSLSSTEPEPAPGEAPGG